MLWAFLVGSWAIWKQSCADAHLLPLQSSRTKLGSDKRKTHQGSFNQPCTGANPLSIGTQDVPDPSCTCKLRMPPGDEGSQELSLDPQLCAFSPRFPQTHLIQGVLFYLYLMHVMAWQWPETWIQNHALRELSLWIPVSSTKRSLRCLYTDVPLRDTGSWTPAWPNLSPIHIVFLVIASSVVCLRARGKSLPEEESDVQGPILYTWPTRGTSRKETFKENNCLLGEI